MPGLLARGVLMVQRVQQHLARLGPHLQDLLLQRHVLSGGLDLAIGLFKRWAIAETLLPTQLLASVAAYQFLEAWLAAGKFLMSDAVSYY
jgi:hypothetical protein